MSKPRMKFELVYALKKAGFPQKYGTYILGDEVHEELECQSIGDRLSRDYCYVPKMEDLVEACGQSLEAIVRGYNFDSEIRQDPLLEGWIVSRGITMDGEHVLPRAFGETMEIALARFFIKLNSDK